EAACTWRPHASAPAAASVLVTSLGEVPQFVVDRNQMGDDGRGLVPARPAFAQVCRSALGHSGRTGKVVHLSAGFERMADGGHEFLEVPVDLAADEPHQLR